MNDDLKQYCVPLQEEVKAVESCLAWVSQQERVRLSAGYMISAWFNSVTSRGWIDAVQARTYNPGSETITFDGLTARAELRF